MEVVCEYRVRLCNGLTSESLRVLTIRSNDAHAQRFCYVIEELDPCELALVDGSLRVLDSVHVSGVLPSQYGLLGPHGHVELPFAPGQRAQNRGGAACDPAADLFGRGVSSGLVRTFAVASRCARTLIGEHAARAAAPPFG